MVYQMGLWVHKQLAIACPPTIFLLTDFQSPADFADVRVEPPYCQGTILMLVAHQEDSWLSAGYV
jgi:hypothetical protein